MNLFTFFIVVDAVVLIWSLEIFSSNRNTRTNHKTTAIFSGTNTINYLQPTIGQIVSVGNRRDTRKAIKNEKEATRKNASSKLANKITNNVNKKSSDNNELLYHVYVFFEFFRHPALLCFVSFLFSEFFCFRY